jgi:hypothetical protein
MLNVCVNGMCHTCPDPYCLQTDRTNIHRTHGLACVPGTTGTVSVALWKNKTAVILYLSWFLLGLKAEGDGQNLLACKSTKPDLVQTSWCVCLSFLELLLTTPLPCCHAEAVGMGVQPHLLRVHSCSIVRSTFYLPHELLAQRCLAAHLRVQICEFVQDSASRL